MGSDIVIYNNKKEIKTEDMGAGFGWPTIVADLLRALQCYLYFKAKKEVPLKFNKSLVLDSWTNPPRDILVTILCKTDLKTVLSVSLVCKHWYQIASDDAVWKFLCGGKSLYDIVMSRDRSKYGRYFGKLRGAHTCYGMFGLIEQYRNVAKPLNPEITQFDKDEDEDVNWKWKPSVQKKMDSILWGQPNDGIWWKVTYAFTPIFNAINVWNNCFQEDSIFHEHKVEGLRDSVMNIPKRYGFELEELLKSGLQRQYPISKKGVKNINFIITKLEKYLFNECWGPADVVGCFKFAAEHGYRICIG